MKRDYDSGISDQVTMFLGTEVEHTPAYGEPTLFVVGVQPYDEIVAQARENEVTHIYFGANQSFPKLEINDADNWRLWESMIDECLSRGFLCTLDLDISCAEGLLESFLVERHNFIPMISVKLPYIQQYGYNATIKLDDKDFNATNPGVWCHSLQNLKNRRNFTPWSKYTQDKVIK
jgi:hypothetical protein